MNKELRKQIWNERDEVRDLIYDMDEEEDIEQEVFYKRLQAVDKLLTNIISEIIQEATRGQEQKR